MTPRWYCSRALSPQINTSIRGSQCLISSLSRSKLSRWRMRRPCWGLANAHLDGSWAKKYPRSLVSTCDRTILSSPRLFSTMRCRLIYRTILRSSSQGKRVVLQRRLRWKSSSKSLTRHSIESRNSKFTEMRLALAVNLRLNGIHITIGSIIWALSINLIWTNVKTWMALWKLVHPNNLVLLKWKESSNFRLYNTITTLTLTGRMCNCHWPLSKWWENNRGRSRRPWIPVSTWTPSTYKKHWKKSTQPLKSSKRRRNSSYSNLPGMKGA